MFGKYKPKNLTESLLPVLIFNWIFGHQIVRYTARGFKLAQTFLYLLFIISIHGYILFYVVQYYIDNSGKYKSYAKVCFIVILVNFTILVINIIFGRIYRNKACKINIKSSKVDKSLEDLGVPVNKQRAYKYSLKLILIWMLSALILNLTVTFSTNIKTKNFFEKIAMIFIVQHPIHVNTLIDLTFCSLIRQVKLRFININQALLKFQVIYSYNLPHIDLNREVNHCVNRQTPKHSFAVFQTLKHSHLQLTSICNGLTQIFACQLIMTMLSSFTLITAMLFNLYTLNFNDEHKSWVTKLSQSSIFVNWVVQNSIKVFFINSTCSKTIHEWKRTGKLVHKLEIKSQDTEFNKEMQKFSIQILQNPLEFSPCGLIDINYSFMRNFVGSITTYLVILIQMSDETH